MVAGLPTGVLLTDEPPLKATVVVSCALLLLILYSPVTTHERYFSTRCSLLVLPLPYQSPSPQALVLLKFHST